MASIPSMKMFSMVRGRLALPDPRSCSSVGIVGWPSEEVIFFGVLR